MEGQYVYKMDRVAHICKPERVSTRSSSHIEYRGWPAWKIAREDSFRPLELKVRSATEESISFDTSVVMCTKARVETGTIPMNYRPRRFQAVRRSAGHGSISNILDTSAWPIV